MKMLFLSRVVYSHSWDVTKWSLNGSLESRWLITRTFHCSAWTDTVVGL